MTTHTHDYAQDSPSRSSPQLHSEQVDVEAQRLPFPALDDERPSGESVTRPRVAFAESNQVKDNDIQEQSPSPSSYSLKRAATGFSIRSFEGVKKRPHRSNTARTYQPTERRPGWEPGQEPGVDTSDPAPPYGGGVDPDGPAHLQTPCDITVIDWSEDNMQMYRLNNDNLGDFLNTPKPGWVACRWINVNGLSWDVIRLLGNHKGLHRLAIEDLMNTRNRTKADFYSDHTYVVMALQKLVNLRSPETPDSDHDSDDGNSDSKYGRQSTMDSRGSSKKGSGAIMTLFKELFAARSEKKLLDQADNSPSADATLSAPADPRFVPNHVRTLQRYRSGPNEDRTEFMERHAVLAAKGLAVSMEQVSIFLNADNTVTSFFEASAEDIEIPIIKRLQTPETILRQSCDASMLTQAIIDTIIDLAIPVTSAYQDALGDIELAVLTDPDIQQSTALYILTTEIAVLHGAIAPIAAIVNALKDHKSEPSGQPTAAELLSTSDRPGLRQTKTSASVKAISAGVPISSLTHTYLGDVDDHIQVITQSYESMRRSADNLVDLIFNTIGAYQNDSMKQLTIVTCAFLPLSFLTGYFGMNFTDFQGIENSDSYFWKIAVPFAFATMVLLLKDGISRFFTKAASKRLIRVRRKQRDARTEQKRQRQLDRLSRTYGNFGMPAT